MHNFYNKNEANIWSNLENAPNFLCSNWAEQQYLDWELVRGVNAGAGALFSRWNFDWWPALCSAVEISSRSIKTAAYISLLLSAITFYTPQPPAVTRDTWHVCPAAVMCQWQSGDQCQCPDWRRRKVEVSDSLLWTNYSPAASARATSAPAPDIATRNLKPASRNARSAPSAHTFPTFSLTQNLWFIRTWTWPPLDIIIVCIIQLTVLQIQSLPCLHCAACVCPPPWLSWLLVGGTE